MTVSTSLVKKSGLCLMVGMFILPAMLIAGITKASATSAYSSQAQFCAALGHSIQASSGWQMGCNGPQPNGPRAAFLRQQIMHYRMQSGRYHSYIVHPLGRTQVRIPNPMWRLAPLLGSASPTINGNVDAANPNEDITPSGFQADGQSEVSIAGQGSSATQPSVVEAWNDSTGFFSPCPSPNYKEELTGFGYSADGGLTWNDQGGLPNDECGTLAKFFGDPSVEAYQGLDGNQYFYITSLFLPTVSSTVTWIAMDACQAIISDPFLTCTTIPIIVAVSESEFTFLDKDFAAIDQKRGRLYVSYTDFGSGTGAGDIKLAVCQLEATAGHPSTTPLSPFCLQPQPSFTSPEPAYVIVHHSESCENEGAYPAVDKATGDVYVAWEFNWFTNIFGGSACNTAGTQVRVARVQRACLPDDVDPSPCAGPFAEAHVNIASMDATFIPGFNRFPMNDFPRIAVSDGYGAVTIVWNDARNKPTGDILLQSFFLGAGFPTPIQGTFFGGPNPTKISNETTPTFTFMPALRNADSAGRLAVTWYDRRLGKSTSAITDVFGANSLNPRTTTTPSNFRVTNVSSDWAATSSLIIPNFGDYTDNYNNARPGLPNNTGNRDYAAWSDGRIGIPQPFNANFANP